ARVGLFLLGLCLRKGLGVARPCFRNCRFGLLLFGFRALCPDFGKAQFFGCREPTPRRFLGENFILALGRGVGVSGLLLGVGVEALILRGERRFSARHR